MSKRNLISAALVGTAVAVSSPVMAQDNSTNFDGPYASVFVGYGIKAGSGDGRLEFDTDRTGRFDDTVFLSSPGSAQHRCLQPWLLRRHRPDQHSGWRLP